MSESSENQFDLYYRRQGDNGGLPILFLHAFPLNHGMWSGQLSALPSKYQGIAYDIRGLGKSPLDVGYLTLESFVEDLISLMDHLKIPKAVLCGLSLGGYVALRAAEKYPHRMLGLVLCDTRSEADDNAGKLKRAESIRLLKSQGVKTFSEGFIPALVCQETLKENPALIERIEAMILSNSPSSICASHMAIMSRTDTTHFLPKISFPSLILVGEEDAITPPICSEEMHRKIPRSTLRVIKKAGHLSNLENPVGFNEALFYFLEDLVKVQKE